MEKRFLSHSDIVRAERITANISRQKIGKWLDHFEKLMDLLLKLNYFYKTDKKASDDDLSSWLFSFFNEEYMEAPYSLHVCNSLMEKGHYLNAMIQLRSLLDYFVSC